VWHSMSLLRLAQALKWPLQFFLGFSSTSSLFGYGGQVNYCAANAMLDQLAVFGDSGESGGRLPCRVITVNWGPWGEAGMAKVGTKAYEAAVREGDTPLRTATALRCLAAALRLATSPQPSAVQFAACDVQWQKSQWQDLPILDIVHERKKLEAPREASPSKGGKANAADIGLDSMSAIEDWLANYISSSWTRIHKKTLVQLGLDSLEVVQLRNQFNKHFSVNVPLRIVAEPSQKVGDLAMALAPLMG